MSVYWKDPNDETVAILTKESNEIITLRVGDFITYKRRPHGVKITGFISKQTDTRGPISLTYLPWCVNEKQWGPTVFTLKGNPYNIIAFPVGAPHWGEQIDWETVELKNGGTCPDLLD